MDYDCTVDVLQHKRLVSFNLVAIANALHTRALFHDDSKLQSPEKECFDKWTPELKVRTFGTEYYKQALDEMGEGVKHHYENNSHHPEHYPNGINDMDLIDLIEMVCDWKAAALARNIEVDLTHGAERFNIDSQLKGILWNTIDRWMLPEADEV